MQRRFEHIVTVAVAAGVAGLALAEGGFPPTAFAATALVVWTAVVIGLAIGSWPRAEPPPAALAAGLCLAGLAALTALSVTWASDNGRAFEDTVRALAYLGIFVLVIVASRRGEARAWLRGLAAGLVIVAGVALLARYEPSLFGSPDADLARDLPAALGRLSYPIGYWNGLAATMAAAIVLCAWFAATGTTRRARSLAVAAMPLPLLALWITDSRGGIIAALIAIAILVTAGPARPRLLANLALGSVAAAALVVLAEQREELLNNPVDPAALGQGDEMLAFTIVAAIVAGAARFFADAPLQRLEVSRGLGRAAIAVAVIACLVAVVAADPIERWDEFKAPPTAEELADGEVGLLRGGGSGRWQFWETAVDAFESEPVKGVGAGGYGPYWLEHREIALDATRAHSVAFEALAELGLVGLALLLGFFGVAGVSGVRRAIGADAAFDIGPVLALLGVGAAAAAVDWTWDLPAVFIPTVIAAGLLVGPATLPTTGDGGPAGWFGTARSRRRFAGGVVVLLVAWLSICASGLLLLADNRLERSRDASAEGDLEGAFDAANDAIDLEPWAAEPRTQLALLYEKSGDIPAARAALDEAIERSPRDFQLYLLEARFAAADDDPDAAAAALARAAELNPLGSGITELAGGSES